MPFLPSSPSSALRSPSSHALFFRKSPGVSGFIRRARVSACHLGIPSRRTLVIVRLGGDFRDPRVRIEAGTILVRSVFSKTNVGEIAALR